jgi:hypothetical protein
METNAAPDTPTSLVKVVEVRPRKLSEELENLRATFAERTVRLQDVIAVLKGRAFILLLILLTLPFCTPIPLPGLSTPFGLIVALISLRWMLGQKPWLPRRLLEKELPSGFFGKLLDVTRKVVRVLEKLLKPRLIALTRTTLLLRMHALVMLISALALLLPLPIPFSNTFPAWSILLMACGLLERDGVFVLASYVVFAGGVLFFFFLGEAAQQLFQQMKEWMLG